MFPEFFFKEGYIALLAVSKAACMSSYDAVRPVMIAPMNCWRNSTPFWCKPSLCTIKIDNFRTIARAYSTLVVLVKDVTLRLGWAGVKGKIDDVTLYEVFCF